LSSGNDLVHARVVGVLHGVIVGGVVVRGARVNGGRPHRFLDDGLLLESVEGRRVR
jgi:hypothetical protein